MPKAASITTSAMPARFCISPELRGSERGKAVMASVNQFSEAEVTHHFSRNMVTKELTLPWVGGIGGQG